MPCAGYVTEKQAFIHETKYTEKPHQYVIISSYENSPGLEKIPKNPLYTLLKKFNQNKAWCAIYAKKQ